VPETNVTATPARVLSPGADHSGSDAGARSMLPFALGGVLLIAVGVTAVYRSFRAVPPALIGAANTQRIADTSIASSVTAQTAQTGVDTSVRLACGEKTYRLSNDKIDDDIQVACEQAKRLLAAVQAYQGATVHYSCKDSDGHIREARTVPKYLVDDYTRNCQEYVVAEGAIRSGTQDRSLNRSAAFAAQRTAIKKFTDRSSEIGLRGAADANELYQQQTTNEAHLNKLIKRAGGSIDIPG